MRPELFQLPHFSALLVGLQEAGGKINAAAHEIAASSKRANSSLQRVIYRELENRRRVFAARPTGMELFPGVSPEARAKARIRRMLVRATAAGVAAAAGATSAELLPLVTHSAATPMALPLGFVSVGAEMLYTTALQIDLAFDLASIDGVPFAADDVGEISRP